ncbi:MAG: ATPase, T2SS/T4P/T4SS family [Planctomycetota bacterium]
MTTFNKKLRSVLLKDGRIPVAEVDEAAEAASRDKVSLSRILIEKGTVSEKELTGLIARSIGLPPIDLSRIRPEPEALELVSQSVAREHRILPLSRIGKFLTIAVVDPFDVLKLDNIRLLTRCDIRPVVTSESQIENALKSAYDADDKKVADLIEGFHGDVDVDTLESAGQEIDLSHDVTSMDASVAPVVKLVNLIIFQAIRERASDIHIEPYGQRLVVRYRQDGVLRETVTPPKSLQNALVSRIKILAGLDIAERRKPQDGKFQVKAEGRQIDFRVSVLPVVHGEKVVLRILDAANLTLRLEALGFEDKALHDFRQAIHAPYGMILVTGPTGSGKSTTLYSTVREIATPEANFVTVEDPVEYQLDGISQVPVNVKRGVTFSAALRSILRQDPDVILIGEIRDSETLEIAVKAALTGHLVLSTLHTNDAPSSITRMIDMGLDPFMVSSSLLLVAAQRLMRKLCDSCKEPAGAIPEERLLSLGFLASELAELQLHRAVGCNQCNAGYRGRFAVLETLPMTEAVRRMVVENRSVLDIKKAALEEGMLTLRRTALLNAGRGKTSLEEVIRVTQID